MVFSLFKGKSQGDGRKGREAPPPRLPDSTLRGPTTSPTTGASTQTQREVARRTAEKIDQIESEMIAAAIPMPPAQKRPPGPNTMMGPGTTGIVPTGIMPATLPFEVPPVVTLGDTADAGEIHVNGSNLPPELEEAAILFANGQSLPAAEALRQAITKAELGNSALQAWMMLFDILQLAGLKQEFDSAVLDFASRFDQPPPPWRDLRSAQAQARSPSTGQGIVFAAVLDAGAMKQVEQVQKAAAGKPPVVIDFGIVTTVQADGASLVLKTIEAFKRAGRELVVLNAARLLDKTLAALQAGRRDPSEACWMLALEMHRLLDHKQPFDDLAIDYCVTYEVSPPSWEPMPPCVHMNQPADITPVASADERIVDSNAFLLTGEITGRMQKELAALRAHAETRADVIIDCRDLNRLDFVAAGELLNEVVSLRGAGKALLFVEPSHVVLALMIVMGIHELAEIRRRKV